MEYNSLAGREKCIKKIIDEIVDTIGVERLYW